MGFEVGVGVLHVFEVGFGVLHACFEVGVGVLHVFDRVYILGWLDEPDDVMRWKL